MCADQEKICFVFKSYDDCVVAFKVYDMDRDGYISNGELFLVLKMMVGNNLKVRQPLMCALVFSFQFGNHHFNLTGPTTTANRGQDDHGGGQGRRW